MIINGKRASRTKTESERTYYFSVLKSILFDLERRCSFIDYIKPQHSKTTDSLYALIHFKNQSKVLKITIRNHYKHIEDGEYRYYADNFINPSELLLTLLRDVELVYLSLRDNNTIPEQRFAKEKYDIRTTNRKLTSTRRKKKLKKKRD